MCPLPATSREGPSPVLLCSAPGSVPLPALSGTPPPQPSVRWSPYLYLVISRTTSNAAAPHSLMIHKAAAVSKPYFRFSCFSPRLFVTNFAHIPHRCRFKAQLPECRTCQLIFTDQVHFNPGKFLPSIQILFTASSFGYLHNTAPVLPANTTLPGYPQSTASPLNSRAEEEVSLPDSVHTLV